MYRFVLLKHKKEINKNCLDFIHVIQKKLKDYFTFDIQLVGSGLTNLVTENGGEFDLDYNLIIKKVKENSIGSDPRKIREKLINEIDKAQKIYDFISTKKNSKSVIKCVLEIERWRISFDLAILIEWKDNLYKLIFDKKQDKYIWNELPNLNKERLSSLFSKIKENNLINEFRERYLELKNKYLSNGEDRRSFSVFQEVINEFKNKLI